MGRKLDGDNPLYAVAEQDNTNEVVELGYKAELEEMSKLLHHEDDPFRFDPLRKG
jgi:hypothetical protein